MALPRICFTWDMHKYTDKQNILTQILVKKGLRVQKSNLKSLYLRKDLIDIKKLIQVKAILVFLGMLNSKKKMFFIYFF